MTTQTGPAPLGRWMPQRRKMGMGFMLPVSEHSHFGLETPRFSDMLEMARLAEDIGFDGCWVADHLFMSLEHEGNRPRGVWEGWTTIAGLAAATRSITFGTFVTCLGWRNPGMVAKMAENIDEISGGRFIFGAGAGWHQPEYEMFGFPWDHRVGRFEDAINIISPMLRDGHVDYQGDYFSANNAVNAPRGPRAGEGGPPILVGTNGPRMQRIAARFADAWNSDWHHDPSSVEPLLANLDEACRDVGRDPGTMVKTAGSNIAMTGYLGRRLNAITGTAEEKAEQISKFRDLGLRHYVAGLDPCTPKTLEEFARVIEILDRTE